MPHKMKIPPADKLRIVEDCIEGRESISGSSKKYGIGFETLRCWIRLYKARGIDGLIPSVKSKKYPPEIKLNAVKDYMSGEGSLNDICVKYDITRHSMLQNWIKQYTDVHRDFKQPNSGGAVYMAEGRSTTLGERIEIVSHCISGDKDYGKTNEKYGVSYQQIYSWVKKYEKYGAEGLVDRRGKRKEEDAMTEVERLQAQLKLKEAENYRLQMENDLLKKLEALERGESVV